MSTAMTKVGNQYTRWARDPPDPNFTTVSPPRVKRVPAIRASRRVSRRAARALNALVRSVMTDVGLVGAVTHAFERTQGALQAGDVVWEARQRAALARYATRLARVLNGRQRLRVRARRALKASGFPKLTATRAAVRRAQRRVQAHGFPKRMRRMFAAVGLTAAEQDAFRAAILGRDPDARSPRSFPAMLTSRAIIRSERASAEAFQRLSDGATAGQSVRRHGSFALPTLRLGAP
jgi:hypothetical protein